MNVFSLDCETQINNKGNPFDETNNLVLGAYGTDTNYSTFVPDSTEGLQRSMESAKLVVLFNAKFDLHWCRRIGIKFNIRLPIWDCQLAEFILSNQQWKYPSLEEACAKRSLGHKIDVIKEEYWNKGIDTDKIPFDILNTYLRQDINLTYLLYLAQVEEFKKPEHQAKYKIFRLQCYDLMVLQEMEYNGYKFNVDQAKKEVAKLEEATTRIVSTLNGMFPDIPLNYSSNDHISCMLYGGDLIHEYRVPVGVYKTGGKIGETRYKIMEQRYTLPRLIEPLKGSELAKEGYYYTNEDVLKNLNATGQAKKLIDLLLERRGIEKLRGTYYDGIPNLIQSMNWKDEIVHGQLNQCVTCTGCLSATKPNQQNMHGYCKRLWLSRYDS